MPDFLDISLTPSNSLKALVRDAHDQKSRPGDGNELSGRMLAMIFEKPSTRTRVSFDVGMRQLGGETLILSGADLQLGRGETVADTARVLSRYVDAIMIRTTEHDRLLELAEHATVPIINGLTDETHPCQILADMMTIEEKLGGTAGKKVAWCGDGNNVLNSLIESTAVFDFELGIAVPEGHEPDAKYLEHARQQGATITVSRDPAEVVDQADCVVTDTWASMGFEEDAGGHNVFMPYQVNEALMKLAAPDAIFMHCLPAHRGEEVTDEVIDGPSSVVFDEAENRLHIQKSILKWCLQVEG